MSSTGTTWRKSSFSGPDGNCVEVMFLSDGTVAVRDSKSGDESPVLTFTRGQWGALLELVTRYELNGADLFRRTTGVSAELQPDGGMTFTYGTIQLQFSSGEWWAFVQGVRANEFALAA